jgi:hypothetical protein
MQHIDDNRIANSMTVSAQSCPLRRSKLYPEVFECNDLWRHSESLFNVLKDEYGNQKLETMGGSYGFTIRKYEQQHYSRLDITTLGQYLDAFEAGGENLPYLRHLSINKALPKLKEYLHLPERFKPNWVEHQSLDRFSGPELFIGQGGTNFGNLHQDHSSVHVGFVQLQGEKEFIMMPPESGQYLYRLQGREFPYQWRNSPITYSKLTDHVQFPLLKNVRPIRLRVKAGQALFLPADWWHTTYNISNSVSYSIRIVNSSNAASLIARQIEGLPRWLNYKLRADRG